MPADSFGAAGTLTAGGSTYRVFRLDAIDGAVRLPYCLKVLLENLLRNEDGHLVTAAQIQALAEWDPAAEPTAEIAFTPARVLLQDFTGVPCLVDLAAMREATAALGGDPSRVSPLRPVELIIEHVDPEPGPIDPATGHETPSLWRRSAGLHRGRRAWLLPLAITCGRPQRGARARVRRIRRSPLKRPGAGSGRAERRARPSVRHQRRAAARACRSLAGRADSSCSSTYGQTGARNAARQAPTRSGRAASPSRRRTPPDRRTPSSCRTPGMRRPSIPNGRG